MHGIDVSPAEKGEGDIILSEGDEGERLIANILLAAMISRLYSETASRSYIARAHFLAKNLAGRSTTYRPAQPSKFARLSIEVAGQIETFLVSIVNETLIVPTVIPEKLPGLLRGQDTVKLAGIELVYFLLRVRTRRIVAALGVLLTTTSQACLLQTAEFLLEECLRQEVRSPEPLVRASDCFALAHNLVGKRNYPLAALLLNDATHFLDMYAKSTQIRDHRAVVSSMKRKITRLLKQITQAAS